MAEDIIQEMDEERRIQRLRTIMRYMGTVLVAVILIGGIGGSIWGWNRHHLHKQQEEASERYLQALTLLTPEEGQESPSAQNQAQARHIFAELTKDAPSGIASFAEMRLAALDYQEGQIKDALSLWKDVSEKKENDESLKGLAQYLWLNRQGETLPQEKQRQFYQSMIQSGGSWASLAREALAGLDLRGTPTLEQKKEAKNLLVEIMSSPQTSDDLRQRAQFLLQILGGDQ